LAHHTRERLDYECLPFFFVFVRIFWHFGHAKDVHLSHGVRQRQLLGQCTAESHPIAGVQHDGPPGRDAPGHAAAR
jgi:hypothetical protein